MKQNSKKSQNPYSHEKQKYVKSKEQQYTDELKVYEPVVETWDYSSIITIIRTQLLNIFKK